MRHQLLDDRPSLLRQVVNENRQNDDEADEEVDHAVQIAIVARLGVARGELHQHLQVALPGLRLHRAGLIYRGTRMVNWCPVQKTALADDEVHVTERLAPVRVALRDVLEDQEGPAASQVAIKQLGTNGGGYFNANSAHPFENPTPLSNLIELFSIFAVSSGLTLLAAAVAMAGTRTLDAEQRGITAAAAAAATGDRWVRSQSSSGCFGFDLPQPQSTLLSPFKTS